MRAYEFLKSCEDISRDLDPHLVEIAKKSFEADHARKYYAPAFFLELYPYLHLFGEHDSFENVDCNNKEDRSKAMKAIFSRLRDPKIDKYRASVLGWLSQVHTEAFFEFIQENNIVIGPLTQPTPFLSVPEVSWKALQEAQSRRDDRLKETGWVEPVIKPNALVEQSSNARGFAPENNNTSSNHLPLIVAGFVGIVFMIWAAWSFTGDTSKVAQTETPTPTPTNVEAVINMPTGENSASGVTEADEVEGEGEGEGDPAQVQDEKEKVVEEPETPIDPVWDEITDREWSLEELRYFYKFINQSDVEGLKQAARSKNPNAMTLQAIGLHVGILKSEDSKNDSVRLLHSACDLQQGRACLLLGWFYENGVGVTKNETRGIALYEQSCNLRIAYGCWYAGSRTFGSGQRSSDYRRSFENHQKGCELGLPITCNWSAYMTFLGFGTQMNEEVAIDYWRKDYTIKQTEQEYRQSMSAVRDQLRANGEIPN